MSQHDTRLQGCWRLVSFETERQDSAERARPFGLEPRGCVVFGDGRMMALVTAEGRAPGRDDEASAALLRTMMAYTGRYRVDGDRFVTTVDACWNEAWNGTEQERFFRLDGDTLDIVSAWMPSPLAPEGPMARGVLRLRRERPA
jgi:hypothetical protein